MTTHTEYTIQYKWMERTGLYNLYSSLLRNPQFWEVKSHDCLPLARDRSEAYACASPCAARLPFQDLHEEKAKEKTFFFQRKNKKKKKGRKKNTKNFLLLEIFHSFPLLKNN